MSRSRHGHKHVGRAKCGVCTATIGEGRRQREEDSRRVDEREQDSLAPVDERRLYDQRPESELYDPGPDPETRRRGGWGGW